MDKELLDLLNQARQAGANESQLQGIVDAYNQKKKSVTPTPSPSSSGVSQSQESSQVPAQSSQGSNPTPDFGLPSFRQLQQQNVAPTENTAVIAPKQSLEHEQFIVEKPQIDAEKARIKQEAIDNGIQDYFKNKGIKAPKGSALYNQQKQAVQAAIDNGLVTATRDRVTGKPGLYRNTGLIENLIEGIQKSNKQADEDAAFVNDMSVPQQLEYLKKSQEQQQNEQPAGFAGERPDAMGSVGKIIGGGARFMGNAALGATTGALLIAGAPETMGGSLAALPIAGSFLATAPDMINSGGADAIKNAFYQIKKEHPEMPDLQAMELANSAKWRGGAVGLATAAAFSGFGGKALSPESQGVVKDAFEKVIKPAVHVGAVTGGASLAEGEIGNLQGEHKSQSEIP